MAFTGKDWRNATTHEGGGDTSTPISAAAIEDLETRVTDYVDFKTSVSVTEPPYNALGDGANDDTAEIQAALDACEAAGGGIVWVPVGTYIVSSEIQIGENVTLCGAGWTTVLKASAGATGNVVRLLGDSDATLENLTVDSNNRADDRAITASAAGGVGTVQARATIRNCKIINSGTGAYAVRSDYPSTDFTFTGNLVQDCVAGFGMEAGVALTTGVRIVGNRFRNVGLVNIQVYTDVPTYSTAKKYQDVLIADNDLADFATPSTAIPIEPTGCEDIVISGNIIRGPSISGISTGENQNMVISENVIVDQDDYAIELNAAKNVVIANNVTEDCDCFVQQTNNVGVVEDVLIANNLIMGGPSSHTGNSYMVRFYDLNAADVKRISIIGNTFRDCINVDGCILLGANSSTVYDALVTGNVMYSSTTATTPITFCTIGDANRVRVSNNQVTIERNLVLADDYYCVVMSNTADGDYVTIEDNTIFFTGTTTGRHVQGIGSGAAGGFSATGMVIRNNRVVGSAGIAGIETANTNADLLCQDNDTRTCGLANAPADVPSTASAATVTLPFGPDTHAISGTTSITSITATGMAGRRVTLIFTDANPGTFTDGSNLKLAGNFDPDTDDTITLVCNGTSWYETGRSVN